MLIRTVIIVMVSLMLYFMYGFMVSIYKVTGNPHLIPPQHPYPFFDYRGATNVLTNRSLGSGGEREIIDEAKRAGLDYLFITDYNLLEGMSASDVYQGDLLVLRGSKYSYLDSRLLYYRLDAYPEVKTYGDIQIHLMDTLSQSSEARGERFLVLAHPFLPSYGWTGDWPIGLSGIEVINFRRIQQQHFQDSKLSSFWSLLVYPFNPELAFIRLFFEPEQEIRLWNSLAQLRKTTGHLGIEATARAIPFTGLAVKFPSYFTLFRLGSEHVLLRSELTGNAMSDRIKVHRALRKGEFYFSLDVLGDPKGFNVVLEEGDQIFLMGAERAWREGMKFRLNWPRNDKPIKVLVYRNADLIEELTEESSLIAASQPGVYRFEVRLKVNLPFPDKSRWIPWIYTNQFRLGEKEQED